MTARFLVAKYIPDLRRREPVNVGVILSFRGQTLAKFQGQRADGSIDGRQVRVGSLKAYKSWVHFWMSHVRGNAFEALLPTPSRGPQNYIIERGGEYLSENDSIDTMDLLLYLYGVLVEPQDGVEELSVSKLTVALFNRLGISDQVKKGYRFTVRTEHGHDDEVQFDYRFDNSAVNLMQKVSLVFDDVRAWDSVHAAAWKFQKALTQHHDVRGTQVIALVKSRPADLDLERQIGVLQECATAVVDVSNQDRAADYLSSLLHLSAHDQAH